MSTQAQQQDHSDRQIELLVLMHWLRIYRDLDDVTVIVRRHGRVVSTRCLSPDGDPTPRDGGGACEPRRL